MPNVGPLEMVFVLVLLLLVFGAKRLPELGSGLGKGIREFKRSISDIKDEVDRPSTIHNPVSRPQVTEAPPRATTDSHEIREPAARNDS